MIIFVFKRIIIYNNPLLGAQSRRNINPCDSFSNNIKDDHYYILLQNQACLLVIKYPKTLFRRLKSPKTRILVEPLLSYLNSASTAACFA